jgi:hypothetical protein
MTHSNKNQHHRKFGDPEDARLFRIDHSQIRPLAFLNRPLKILGLGK